MKGKEKEEEKGGKKKKKKEKKGAPRDPTRCALDHASKTRQSPPC